MLVVSPISGSLLEVTFWFSWVWAGRETAMGTGLWTALQVAGLYRSFPATCNAPQRIHLNTVLLYKARYPRSDYFPQNHAFGL